MAPEERVKDLASRLSIIKEIAGLMMYSVHQMVPKRYFVITVTITLLTITFALLPVLSCASLHSFSSLLVFWIPVFQVLWISIACLEEVVRTRDY